MQQRSSPGATLPQDAYEQERMENLLERNIGIEKYFSYIVLKSPIVKNVLPLKTLLDPQAQ